MTFTFGDGTATPPLLSRESVELQRACITLAWLLRKALPENLWSNIEADVAPHVARFVVHYADSLRFVPDLAKTVEIHLHPGLPLDRSDWLEAQVDALVDMINRGASDLVLPMDVDYLRLIDEGGSTVFEYGKAVEFPLTK